MSASAPTTHCANCGHRVAAWDKFCSQCGQDTANHAPSLWEFVHEFLLHYVAFEGKLWKSLWGLMARPGYLTAEYLAGRKQRYVLPLRLVLTLGLVFFLALKFSAKVQDPYTGIQAIQAAEPEAAPGRMARASEAAEPGAGAEDDAEEPWVLIGLPDAWMAQLPQRVREGIQAANKRMAQDPRAELARVGKRMLDLALYAVLLSLPFFAGLLKLLYWRQPYGAHFVFAMHLHAAWYGFLLLGLLLPDTPLQLGLWIWLWANLYPVLALRRVHPASWPSTLVRASGLALMHWVLITAALLTLVLVGAMSG